jgi:hypothetical protein
MAIELQNFGDTRLLVAGGGLELVQLLPGRIQVQLAGGGPQQVTKLVTTTRNTTNFAADPELVLAAVPAGTYLAIAMLRANSTGAGGGGLKFRYAVSAGAIDANGGSMVVASQSIGLSAAPSPGTSTGQNPATGHTSAEPTTATTVPFWWQAILKLSSVADLSIEWAQNSAVAPSTNLFVDSSLRLLPLA